MGLLYWVKHNQSNYGRGANRLAVKEDEKESEFTMSTLGESPERNEPPQSGGAPPWLIAALTLLALVVGYLAYGQRAARLELQARLEEANDRLAQLESRAASIESASAGLREQLGSTGEQLGTTQQELARARALAQQIKEEQKRAAEQLGGQIAQQKSQLGSLSGEVGTVAKDVADTRKSLAETQMKLERTIGDLGQQSGLIAKNHGELEELKRRGERDYFEFAVQKSKNYTRVGAVSLRLTKTDTKRQKYTVEMLANDKRIEKKDKTLLEPVQFYLQGSRHLLEVVVYEVNKDKITGYLSAPKELAMRQ